MALRTLSVCAGVGGLDLGVRIARPDSRCVAFVEREASAAASLVASMAAGRLHPAAVWSDLRTFDAGAWRGAVDCVLSGDPCQGNSVAGKRLGADDDRWLLDAAIDVFDRSGAHTFFRENVPGNLAGQIAAAVPALERLGCRVACGIFSAAEAGASHRRERFFILAKRQVAIADGPRSQRWWRGNGAVGRQEPNGHARLEGGALADPASWRCGTGQQEPARFEQLLQGSGRTALAGHGGGALVDASRFGWGDGRTEHVVRGGWDPVANSSGALADPERGFGEQHARRWSGSSSAQSRWTSGEPEGCGGILPAVRRSRPFAPGPSNPVWAEIVRDAPSLEPAVCRVAHGVAGRIERLRHCGNGVVPLTAALAWVRLHGLLADAAAGDAVRFADDRSASAGAAAMRAAA